MLHDIRGVRLGLSVDVWSGDPEITDFGPDQFSQFRPLA